MWKVAIWASGYPSKCIWTGKMPSLPTEGDFIEVYEGFCSEAVKFVTYCPHNGTAEIKLKTDDSEDEYPTIILDKEKSDGTS